MDEWQHYSDEELKERLKYLKENYRDVSEELYWAEKDLRAAEQELERRNNK